MDCGHELIEGNVPCQYSYYYGSVIGDGKAEIVGDPQEKLKGAVLQRRPSGNAQTYPNDDRECTLPGKPVVTIYLKKTGGMISWLKSE